MTDRGREISYDPRRAAAEVNAAVEASQMAIDELWFAYVGVGGNMTRSQLSAALAGSSVPNKFEYGPIAQALNEYFRYDATERGRRPSGEL